MKRPWQVWLLFAACVLGAFSGMAWLTRQRSTRMRGGGGGGRSRTEQRVSLALWRMDTELAPIIAAEVIRRRPSIVLCVTLRRSHRRMCCCNSRRCQREFGCHRRLPVSNPKDAARLAELRKLSTCGLDRGITQCAVADSGGCQQRSDCGEMRRRQTANSEAKIRTSTSKVYCRTCRSSRSFAQPGGQAQQTSVGHRHCRNGHWVIPRSSPAS